MWSLKKVPAQLKSYGVWDSVKTVKKSPHSLSKEMSMKMLQASWTSLLNKAGIDVNSTRVGGGIKTEEELRERLGGDRK